MRKYVSYLRVSTTRQGESGLGIEAQRNAVTDYLSRSGGQLIAEYVEVESGSKKARPILVNSISHARQNGSVLLIAKLDRLGRNVAFVSSLMESGVEFLAVDAPYANRLMIHILSAFAEHERELISQRTKDALRAAKARGVKLGVNGAILAARNRDGALEHAALMRGSVESAVRSGATTLAGLSIALNRDGFRTRAGALWQVGTTH